jgi:hypothetical protein
MHRRIRSWLWLLAWPGAAFAHSVTEEAGLSNQPATPNVPSQGSVYDRLGASFDLGDLWTLRGDAIITVDESAPPQQGTRFGDSGGVIPSFDLAGELRPNEHFMFGLELDASPKAKQSNDAQISLTTPTTGNIQADADLRTSTSSLGFVATAGADTAGESAAEFSGSASFGLSSLSTDQAIIAAANRSTSYDIRVLRSYCLGLRQTGQRVPRFCAPVLGEPGDINQSHLGATATVTILQDTDVGLTGVYYFYDKDPTTVGYFNLAARGRFATGGVSSFGQGLAIAPYLFTLRPDLAHAFGPIRFDLAYQYGQYWPGQGYSHQLTLKTDLKLSTAWKIYVTLTGEQDTDGTGAVTYSEEVVAGVRFKF